MVDAFVCFKAKLNLFNKVSASFIKPRHSKLMCISFLCAERGSSYGGTFILRPNVSPDRCCELVAPIARLHAPVERSPHSPHGATS